MIAEANGVGAQNPNGGMPGQLQGEAGVLDFEPDAADQGPVAGGAEGDGTDDEADIEVCGVENSMIIAEVRVHPSLQPLPVRILRNVVNRLFGGGAAETPGSSSSSEGGNIDQDGVD